MPESKFRVKFGVELSSEQNKILDQLKDWIGSSKGNSFITMGGYAGTGKTTLISVLRNELDKTDKKKKVAFASFTGKAARVLRGKLVESKSIFEQDTCGTIHSLIYSPVLNNKEEIIGWERRKEVEAGLIIIDEASMVDEEIWKDLLSYGIPIVAVGDHGQLPPVRGNFNLMEKPMLKLEEIHRQAKENPIIKLSILARERGVIPAIDFGEGVRKIRKNSMEASEVMDEVLRSYREEILILCGYNFTRINLNKTIRRAREVEGEGPEPGDRVICLRNNRAKQIFNGMLGTLLTIESKDEDWYEAEIEMDGEEENYQGLIYKRQFNNPQTLNFTGERYKLKDRDLFDFGYALTVHKAQGSQARKVVLFEERFPKMDEGEWRRWLYTGITRAESELVIVG